MSRKAAIAARALRYSAAHHERGADSLSWEDGYRAALRGVRRAIRNAHRNAYTGESYAEDRYAAVEQFLNGMWPR